MNYFKISKFFLFLVPFTVTIVSVSTLFPFIVGKYVWFRTVIDLALFFFLLGLLLNRDAKDYKTRLVKWFKSPLGAAITAFTLFFLLASFFAFDAHMAFWSNFERGEGGLQMIHLYLFALLLSVLLKSEKDWQKMLWLSLIAALLMIFYGTGAGLKYVDAEITEQGGNGSAQPVWSGKGGILFQLFKNFIGPAFNESGYRFQGSIGNPAYVATYLIFMFFFTLYLFFASNRSRIFSAKKIFLTVLFLIFLIFFALAATRGAFVGWLASLFIGAIYLVFVLKRWRKPLLILIILSVLLIGSTTLLVKKTNLNKSVPALRIFDISFSARTLIDRTYIWQAAVAGFKERPILGWGPENFSQVFDRKFPIKYFTPERGFGAWFDRAHNIFLDRLVETGILGLLSYVAIFIVFYVQFFKSNLKEKISEQGGGKSYILRFMLFSVPIAYLVQGLVLFEVLVIYINLFLFLAFANFKFQEKEIFRKV